MTYVTDTLTITVLEADRAVALQGTIDLRVAGEVTFSVPNVEVPDDQVINLR